MPSPIYVYFPLSKDRNGYTETPGPRNGPSAFPTVYGAMPPNRTLQFQKLCRQIQGLEELEGPLSKLIDVTRTLSEVVRTEDEAIEGEIHELEQSLQQLIVPKEPQHQSAGVKKGGRGSVKGKTGAKGKGKAKVKVRGTSSGR
ncbi:unnamed protein product, partial [Choristocarpus tenellus]